jgi:isopenicillin N synthase-like dioxygenase
MNSRSEIPVLDVSAIVREDSPGIDDLAREMSEACRGIGFFCVTGHGIDLPVRRHTFEMSRTFFALPFEQKVAVTMTRSPNNLGYMPFASETLDPNLDADVTVLLFCVGDDRPAKYPPTTGAAYLKERLNATQEFRRDA